MKRAISKFFWTFIAFLLMPLVVLVMLLCLIFENKSNTMAKLVNRVTHKFFNWLNACIAPRM